MSISSKAYLPISPQLHQRNGGAGPKSLCYKVSDAQRLSMIKLPKSRTPDTRQIVIEADGNHLKEPAQFTLDAGKLRALAGDATVCRLDFSPDGFVIDIVPMEATDPAIGENRPLHGLNSLRQLNPMRWLMRSAPAQEVQTPSSIPSCQPIAGSAEGRLPLVSDNLQRLNIHLLASRLIDGADAFSAVNTIYQSMENTLKRDDLTATEKQDIEQQLALYKGWAYISPEVLGERKHRANARLLLNTALKGDQPQVLGVGGNGHTYSLRIETNQQGRKLITVNDSGHSGDLDILTLRYQSPEDQNSNRIAKATKGVNSVTFDVTDYLDKTRNGSEQLTKAIIKTVNAESSLFRLLDDIGEQQEPRYFNAKQKKHDCTTEAIFADLHHTMGSYSAYLKVKIDYLQTAKDEIARCSDSALGGMLRHLNQGPFGVFIPDLGVDGLEEVDQLKDSAMIQSVREKMVSAIDARINKATTSLATGKERLAFSRNDTIESTDHLCMQSTAGDKRQYAQQQKQSGEQALPPTDLVTDLAQLKEQLRAMKLS